MSDDDPVCRSCYHLRSEHLVANGIPDIEHHCKKGGCLGYTE